jgi:hypothetical protein
VPEVEPEVEAPPSIDFDHVWVCAELGIPECPEVYTGDSVAYGDHFFAYIAENVEDEFLAAEANASRKIFARFVEAIRNKEGRLLHAREELQQMFMRMATQRCDREMEAFSCLWRERPNESPGAFPYDLSEIPHEIHEFAELALAHHMPLKAPDLVGAHVAVSLCEQVVKSGIRFLNLTKLKEFLDENEEIEDDDKRAVELCARIIVCVECFDAKQLLLQLAHRISDRDRISALFPD